MDDLDQRSRSNFPFTGITKKIKLKILASQNFEFRALDFYHISLDDLHPRSRAKDNDRDLQAQTIKNLHFYLFRKNVLVLVSADFRCEH